MHGSAEPVSISRSATEQLVLAALGDGEASAAEVGERVGISRATAQRHLAALAARTVVEVSLRYGATGRPEHRYAART
jgi:two-component system CitB family response regulator